MSNLINVNAFHKELRKFNLNYTYIKAAAILAGIPSDLTPQEKKQITSILTEVFKELKQNVKKA